MHDFFAGYEKQIQLLQKLIDTHRFPHAVLLTGPDGNALPSIANHLAASLLCNAGQSQTPCRKCDGCRYVLNLSHPDVYWIFPVAKSKEIQHARHAMKSFREFYLHHPYFRLTDWSAKMEADNKQMLISVEDSRNLMEHLSLTSMMGKWKVVILWAMEKMNAEASNKLLKILEEPDQYTRFICISHHPSELLPTILSRLQIFRFPALAESDILLHLKNIFPEEKEEFLKNVSANAEGIIANALEWITLSESENEFLELFRAGMRAALKFHSDTALEWVEKCASFPREKQKQFLEYALQTIRKCMLMNLHLDFLCSILPGEKEFLEKFHSFVSLDSVSYWQQVLDDAMMHVERNANPKILFMDLLFTFNELLHLKKTA